MSSIVGFINLDREPGDRKLLLQLCEPLKGRSPDGTNTWVQGSAGLGHASLLTSHIARVVSQPCTLDGREWVISDAHIYDKENLVQQLCTTGLCIEANETDSNLLLLAYRAFGDAFARHLVGDFAIAIWDKQREKLICARDHLGVRPFFYAHTEECFVFSSSIDAIRAHPKVSSELNELFIADGLLFGSTIDSEATAYKDIKRLPAAHYLSVDASGIQLHKYWTPPIDNEIRYSQDSEYTEHFLEIFERAVTERVPASHIAQELTGGMDSGSIAAVVAAHARDNGQQIQAYTNTCQEFIPEDREGHFARMTADHLGIPLQFLASEDYPLFDRFDRPFLNTAEPFANPNLARHYDMAERVANSGCRVLLTGHMGDAVFAGSGSHFFHLAKRGRFVSLINELIHHRRKTGSLVGTGVRTRVRDVSRHYFGRKSWRPDLPVWLNPDFARRVSFEERWSTMWNMWGEFNDISGQLQRPWLSAVFEDYEAVNLPMLVRHPFADVRLIEFMMGIPNYLQINKQILRDAMHQRLPYEILARPKEGMPGDISRIKMEKGFCNSSPSLEVIRPYVDVDEFKITYNRFIKMDCSDSTWFSGLINNPIALAYWMNNNDR